MQVDDEGMIEVGENRELFQDVLGHSHAKAAILTHVLHGEVALTASFLDDAHLQSYEIIAVVFIIT